MLESEKEADMEFGYLVVFRKGKTSSPYELDEGDHSIGSSSECNIRLKFSHPLLLQIHALIRVNEDGVATILNKSVGAPVKVNDKVALRPTILKHADKFEILDKVFQYFNDHLKHEPEDSQKFVKGKLSILNKGRQSVHPLSTPAKKSPILKTKTLSVRKSTSAVPRPTKGLQVIITPSNKKPDSHVGSKTTSKIVVSKALASPCNAKKRRLSLDNPHKVSQTPKISSRNILLSKSTINITISEEHEYSEIVPLTSNRTVQDEDKNLKTTTPRRSVKVENGNTPNNDVSVALIDFNSPTPVRKSAVRPSTLESLNEDPAENQSSINGMKTPVNKRIQSLKTVRHSLKKDTPPPRLALPKVMIQAPTPPGKVQTTTLNKSSLDDSVNSLVKSPEKSLGTSRKSSRSAKSNMSPNYLFYTTSKRSRRIEESSQSDDNTVDEGYVNKSSRVSRNTSRGSTNIKVSADTSQTEDNTTDEGNVNKSSRASRSTSRRSTNIKLSTDTSQSEDNIHTDDNINKPSRLSINASRRTRMIKGPTSSSQTDDNTSDVEDNVSLRVDAPFNSQTETDSTDEDNVNKISRASRNTSRRSTKNKVSTSSSQTDDIPTDVENNITMSSRFSRSLRVDAPFNSQTETDITEDNVNKSSRVSRNTSRRNTKNNVSANTSQAEDNIDTDDNINKSYKLSINASRRSRNIEATGSSENDDITTNMEDSINMSSRFSRSLRVDAPFNSQTETDTADEDNVNKFSRVSRRRSRRSTKIRESADTFQTKDNIDAEDINKSSRVSRNASRRSRKMDASTGSSQTDYNTTDAQDNRRSESVSSLLTDDYSTDEEESSLDKSTSAVQDVPTYRSDHSSRRSTVPRKSQSSINSAETTMDMQQKSRNEADITNSTKNKSLQGLSLFDETTQEAKQLNTSASKNRSRQRVSIFDESTREAFPQSNKVKSMKPISILDESQEVLSPVRPLSPSKSIRNIQNEDREGSVSSSIRVSSIRRSRRKSRTLQDSSLTSTSVDQSSSSVISVSSQSFSSFKKGSSARQKSRDETEIDVVNISSDTEVKRSFKDSGRSIQKDVLEKSNTFRSSGRQPRTSEMFKDVSCTSTPFHKNVSGKERSRESEPSDGKNSTKHDSSLLLINITRNSDSVFASPSGEKGTGSSSKRTRSSSNIFEETGTVRRRRSSRASVSKLGDEHDCVSCRNSSMKRSRSLSLSAAGESSKSLQASKPARKSSGILHKPIYEDHSPVKRVSSVAPSKVTTPLLHRISHVTSLSDKTPEKCAETEDETPKSSIKPARRSSKSNQSVYNPTVEDITPVTPEKLMTSGLAEDVFKTPINTPGLFENIRKSVIRSRKRHRESTGSIMKDAKRPRVDFAQEEKLETSTVSTDAQQESRRTSPLNRLSNFEGVKKLMRTPSKSPKNDLTNVAGVKKMFSTPKDVKSPRNDLTKIPNLRRLVSPKRQNTPKNDLTKIPNLKRIMSPKQQNSPKNDLSSPVGVKRLLKTPTVQKEPIDNLGNVTGVASMFNVSGVEVLHQGSDIENSEDLFTQLTGKRPVKAYPRGKSLSPNKDDVQDQAHSRKTMGDIPICSPRVQQWVEEHANVNYVTTETAPGLLSEDEDVLFNVSKKPARKSKSGRSVSPKKRVRDMKNRRKTQGDALGDDPNITAWKQEQTLQVKTPRKLSADRNINIKPEIGSPLPLQTATTIAEKVTPKQLKLKKEIVTPKEQQMAPVGEGATPVSVRARRGRPKQVEDILTSKEQQVTPVGESATPASVRAKRGRPKLEHILTSKEQQITPVGESATPASIRAKRERPKQLEDILTSKAQEMTPVGEIATPASVRARRGRPKQVDKDQQEVKVDQKEIVTSIMKDKTPIIVTNDDPEQTPKEIENKPIAAIKPGRRVKKIMSDLDVLTSTTASPIEEPVAKKPRSRRGVPKIDSVDPEVDKIIPKTRTRRGKIDSVSDDVTATTIPKNRRVQKPSESNSVDEAEINKPTLQKKTGAVKATPEVSASPARRGGRRGKLVEDKAENKVFSDTVDIGPTVSDKPTSRSRGGRKIDELALEEPIVDADIKKPASKGRRGKKEEPQTDETNVDHKVTPNIKPEVKGPSRDRKAKNMEDEEAAQNANVVVKIEKPVVKKSTRGRRAKKCEEDEANQIEEYVDSKDTQKEKVEIAKRPPRGRKAKKAEEETAQIEEPDKATIGNMDTESGEVEVVKPTRGRKAKKIIKEEVPENTDVDDQIEEPVLAKTMRSKRGRKGEDKQDAKEDTQVTVKEVFERKPKGRGIKKNLIREEAAEEISDPEVEFQYTPRNTRSSASGAEMVETVTSPAKKGRKRVQIKDESVPNPPAANAVRGRRGANVVEVQSEVVEKKEVKLKGILKRKVYFEGQQGAENDTPTATTRKSKRTRK